MANPEHVALLARGAEIWNAWRNSCSKVTPNLSGAAFRGAQLPGVNLGEAFLVGVDFSGATLRGADLHEAYLLGANLCAVDLSQSQLQKAVFSRADLRGADFSGARLQNVVFSRANLCEVAFTRAQLIEAVFTEAEVSKAEFREADLGGADLSEADFRGANFIRAALRGAKLGKTDLRGADLRYAVLDEAYLTGVALWKTQRAGWSIKNVICDHAFWDRDCEDVTPYIPGEFERCYSEERKITLHYSGVLTAAEVATLPALVQYLNRHREGCRLQSIQEDSEGTIVTIVIDEEMRKTELGRLQERAQQLQAMQRQMLGEGESRQTVEMQTQRLFELFGEFVGSHPAQSGREVSGPGLAGDGLRP
jgi:uncharacterized protein YjbI with pentapeptide repeats